MQDSDDSDDRVLPGRMQPSLLLVGDGFAALPADKQAHTHRALGSPHLLYCVPADCLEETVANHLISILASTVSHLQHQSAEQNAVEQGQTRLWQSSQCRLPSVGGGGMQRIKINNLAIIRGTVQADTSAD